MTDFLASEDSLPDVDMNRPHPARMYDYYLGGKNHFAADRAVADAALASWPAGRIGLRENRRFLGRVVRYLAADAGIRQFLDIGSGLPTQANVDDVSDADIVELNIPTGQPLVYELDDNLKPLRHYYLGDEEAIKASMQAVANQGKSGG